MDKRCKNITKKDLILEIQKLSKELGRTAGRRELNREYFVKKLFGTHNNLVKEAGLIPNQIFNFKKEDLISIIIDFYNKNEIEPTIRDIENNKEYPSIHHAITKINWNETVKEVLGKKKVRVNRKAWQKAARYSKLTNEELSIILKSEVKKLKENNINFKRYDLFNQFRNNETPSHYVYEKRFKMKWKDIISKY